MDKKTIKIRCQNICPYCNCKNLHRDRKMTDTHIFEESTCDKCERNFTERYNISYVCTEFEEE